MTDISKVTILISMKQRDLLRKIKKMGDAKGERLEFIRNGANHDIYRIKGVPVVIPRHGEIKEGLAKGILKDVKEGLQ